MASSLKGRFDTRHDAELAIEHLVQEHGIDRSRISVLPLGGENTVGTRKAGSDVRPDQPGTSEREHAALHGAIELSVSMPDGNAGALRQTLMEAGAHDLAEV